MSINIYKQFSQELWILQYTCILETGLKLYSEIFKKFVRNFQQINSLISKLLSIPHTKPLVRFSINKIQVSSEP